MKYITIFILFLHAFANAQDKQPMFFKVYSVSTTPENLAYGPIDESNEVTFKRKQRSPFYKIAKTNKIVFYDRDKPLNEDGKLNIIAKASISPSIKQPLLVFVPTERKDDGTQLFDIITLDDNSKAFSGGKSYFINLTKSKVALVFGKKNENKIFINPKQAKAHEISSGHVGNLPFKVYISDNKTAKLAVNSYLFPTKKGRSVYFIWPKTNPSGKGNLVKIDLMRQNAAQIERDDKDLIELKLNKSG
ncbi:hypothetical protein [Persicirhabdus sediminis]|uniref:Uncharacterized protein n=1 Tax=Persicirhabdus sediminis TaxID=454144 RepID=A0A8J7SHE1_9BACT|nr:hypothetical protein [Persicirhabdus sediminis]MBK1789779.1 hypothetical protein [Persicirhabdus sediminis]